MHWKLWIQAGGDREKVPAIWEAKLMTEPPTSQDADISSEWEAPSLKSKFPRPCNWRKKEFDKWTNLVSQGRGIINFKGVQISNNWLQHYRSIPHRKLLTAVQLRANIYPTREFLARGRQDKCNKTCRHCEAGHETCTHIIGNCLITPDARIKRHNNICQVLSEEAVKEDRVVFQEPHIRDSRKDLYKPDLIFVKDTRAFILDVTVWYKSDETSLEMVAEEKADKYKHLTKEIQNITNAKGIAFMGFPLGAWGKWYNGNFELLKSCTI